MSKKVEGLTMSGFMGEDHKIMSKPDVMSYIKKLEKENRELREKLELAIRALKEYRDEQTWTSKEYIDFDPEGQEFWSDDYVIISNNSDDLYENEDGFMCAGNIARKALEKLEG